MHSRDDQLRTTPNHSASTSTSAGDPDIGPLHTYTLDDIPRTHADLEHNRVFGKLVGVIDPPADVATTVQR